MARSSLKLVVCVSLLLSTAPACKEVRQAMGELESAAMVAPVPPEMRTDNVIPSADPVEMLAVTVQDERTLTQLANSLGATVDDIMIDNRLDDSRVASGTELQVRTTRSRLDRYVKRRETRRKQAASRAKGRRASKVAKRSKRRRKAVKRGREAKAGKKR